MHPGPIGPTVEPPCECSCGEVTKYAAVIAEALALGIEEGPCLFAPLTPSGKRPSLWCHGRSMNVSRAVWTLAFGDAGELHVLHTCGEGAAGCIRLAHLYLGTPRHNIEDAMADRAGFLAEQSV